MQRAAKSAPVSSWKLTYSRRAGGVFGDEQMLADSVVRAGGDVWGECPTGAAAAGAGRLGSA